MRGGAGAGRNNRPQAAEQGPSGARNTIMREMFEDIGMWNLSQSPMSLTLKNHRHAPGPAIFKAAAEVLASSERLPYANDGLIFTPASLYVWGVYANGRPVSIAPELGRWDRVFKWKPADQNSIDFLVRDTERVKMVGAQRFKGFQLLCGLNMGKTKPITVPEGMRYLHDPEARGEVLALRERYEPAPFDPVSYYQEDVDVAWIPIDGDGQCRTTDGEVMTDESIVEFRYIVPGGAEPEGAVGASGAGWRPMRLREDKTRLYRSTHNISRAANDMSTARNIWITIFEPVTRAMVSGADAVSMAEITAKEASVENRYYARDIARYHLLSVNMQNFHNLVVKRFMFEYPDVSYRRTLLELACGQAGDLPRWTDAGYAMVVGIDKNQNNIEDPANGAYARALRVLTERRGRRDAPPPGMAFLIGDCGELLSTGAAFRDAAAEESAALWTALSGGRTGGTSAEYVRAIAAGFRETGSGSRGLHFDVVSCQFATHYFFKSAETLDTFLTNVAGHLRPGGYFLATFMDGDSVHDALEKEVASGRGGVVKGVVANTVIWAVQRLWTGVYDPATEDVYGKEIGVYLENTRQTITEYLVPFDVLKQKAAAHGLKLDRSETFGQTFERESRAHSTWEDPLKRIFDQFRREPVQRRFSSFNRWAVFRKA
jgi:SAM-dependent methyltransferase